MSETPLTDDLILPFQVGESAVRGRLVRLGDVVDEVLRRQDLPLPAAQLVGEATALVAMLGASLKFDGRLTLQAQGDGPISMLVADFIAGGGVRATAKIADDGAAALPAADAPLSELLGKGHIALTIDQGPDMDRYQGVTPVEGASLAEAAIGYFDQSEQIPTAMRLAVGRVMRPGEGEVWRAGGVMVQFVPGEGGTRERGEAMILADEDQDAWERASLLLDTTKSDELLDPGLSPEELLFRLYHEDGVRVFDASKTAFFCTCSREKVAGVLSRYSPEDLQEMAEDGAIKASCDFCRTEYAFDVTGGGEV